MWDPNAYCGPVLLVFDKQRPNPGQLVTVQFHDAASIPYDLYVEVAGYPYYSLGIDTTFEGGDPHKHGTPTPIFSTVRMLCDATPWPSPTVTESITSGYEP
jgi:hypothetical protein